MDGWRATLPWTPAPRKFYRATRRGTGRRGKQAVFASAVIGLCFYFSHRQDGYGKPAVWKPDGNWHDPPEKIVERRPDSMPRPPAPIPGFRFSAPPAPQPGYSQRSHQALQTTFDDTQLVLRPDEKTKIGSKIWSLGDEKDAWELAIGHGGSVQPMESPFGGAQTLSDEQLPANRPAHLNSAPSLTLQQRQIGAVEKTRLDPPAQPMQQPPAPIPAPATEVAVKLGKGTQYPADSGPGCAKRPMMQYPQRWRPLRWLFFQEKEDMKKRMDPFFRVLIQGAQTDPLVEVAKHWGPGFPKWTGSLTLKQNIAAQFGSPDYFDVLMYCGGPAKYPTEFKKDRTLVISRKHECREGEECEKPLREHNNDMVAMVNPFEIAENKKLHPNSRQMLLSHVPSPTLTKLMYSPYDAERNYDITLLGSLDRVLYPLRNTWHKLLGNAESLGLGHAKQGHKRHPQHFTKIDHVKQIRDYARMLKSSKILLTDSATVHYSVQKYTEGLMAGCLLIGDIPHDRMREYRRLMVEVPTKAPIEQLAKVVRYWLSHNAERLAKTTAAQQWVSQNYGSTEAFYRDTTELYYEAAGSSSGLQAAQGRVGKLFNYPFYIRCRAAGGKKWCEGEKRRRAQGVTKLPHDLMHHKLNQLPIELHHPSFGGLVDPSTTDLPAGTNCLDMEPPSYMSRWRPLRWLLLQSRHDAQRTFDLAPWNLGLAGKTYPHAADLTNWGPGFPGWDPSLSLPDNIKQSFGNPIHFDIIFYSTHSTQLPADLSWYSKTRTVLIAWRYECVAGRKDASTGLSCVQALQQAALPDIVALGNPHELQTNEELSDLSTDALLVHIPAFGCDEFMPPDLHDGNVMLQAQQRPIDVLILYRPGSPRYPRPLRFANVKEFTLWRSADYQLSPPSDASPPTMALELSTLLKQSKIVVVDCTPRRYWVEELTYALLAGALVLSDGPAENLRAFRRFAVPLKRSELLDVSAVERIAGEWLSQDNGARRTDVAAAGQAWARRNLHSHSALDALTESYYEVLSPPFGEGLVGKKFLHPFFVGCRADGGEEWCQGEDRKRRGK